MDNIYIKKDDLFEHKATYNLLNKLFVKDLISVDDLICKIEDLSSEIEELKEQIEDMENADEEPIRDPYDYYGVSRNNFI